jgi:fructose-1,6-bisphosphatase/sedoheptulose 1,7-bisphosphatase-like protein
MASGRVQPVILTDQENPGIERHLVSDGDVAASVIVTGQRQVGDVIRLAPRKRWGDRRAVLTAALLPVPTARALTR